MVINEFVPDSKIFNSMNSFKVMDSGNANDPSTNFTSILKEKLDEVNDEQVKADETVQSFIKGDDNVDIQDVMLSDEEAKVSLDMAVQVRNKLIDAYQELNKMQI